MTPAPHRKQPRTIAEKRAAVPLLKDAVAGEIIGYARVSTEEQNLGVQLTALKDAGAAKVFVEKISAVNLKRPQFNLMMKYVERGDTILFHNLSRIGRHLPHIHQTLDAWTAEGVAWRSLTEPHLDNTTASGRLMLNITGAMAQFERDQIIDRTRRGMAECRRRGMALGRKAKVTPAIARQMAAMRRKGKTGEQIARAFRHLKIKPSTVYARTNPLLRAKKSKT